MNKTDVIASVSRELNVSKQAAGRAVNAVFDCIAEHLKDDQVVTISGFGKFRRSTRRPRTILHPGTGAEMETKEIVTVRFRPSEVLRSRFQAGTSRAQRTRLAVAATPR